MDCVLNHIGELTEELFSLLRHYPLELHLLLLIRHHRRRQLLLVRLLRILVELLRNLRIALITILEILSLTVIRLIVNWLLLVWLLLVHHWLLNCLFLLIGMHR